MEKTILIALAVVLTVGVSGCSREFVGGAAIGAGGVGAAYEYQNKKALDELENDFKAGKVGKDEYLDRKKDIQEKSLLY